MDSAQTPPLSITAQQTPPASSPDPAPGKKKKLIIMIAIAVALFIALLAGIIFLLINKNNGTDQAGDNTDPLLASSVNPLADSSPLAGESPTTSSTPNAEQSVIPPSPSPAVPVKSLLVALSYTTQPAFTISIDNVEYVSFPPTVDMIKADRNSPHSVIMVEDQDGNLIYEETISLTTQVWVTTMDSDPFVETVPDGAEDLVIPVPASAEPRRVKVITDEGRLLDEYEITSLTEPPDGAVLGDQEGQFIIAVVNENNAYGLLSSAHSETLTMVRTISPWSKHEDQVKVTPVPNTASLGCKVVKGPGGAMYPLCANQGRISNVVSGAIGHWDAIVVINNVKCGCGMVSFNGRSFPPIAAVGIPSYPQLIAHELGHAIGHMTDEYMHKFGGLSYMGENCFYSQDACEQAIAPYKNNRDAQCSAGCNQISTWRPATLMMYSNLRPGRFGPVEKCEMEKKIAAILGIEADCEEDENAPSPQPSASGDPKDFYGWSR